MQTHTRVTSWCWVNPPQKRGALKIHLPTALACFFGFFFYGRWWITSFGSLGRFKYIVCCSFCLEAEFIISLSLENKDDIQQTIIPQCFHNAQFSPSKRSCARNHYRRRKQTMTVRRQATRAHRRRWRPAVGVQWQPGSLPALWSRPADESSSLVHGGRRDLWWPWAQQEERDSLRDSHGDKINWQVPVEDPETLRMTLMN